MTKCCLGLMTVLATSVSLVWAEQDVLYDVKVISAYARPAGNDSVLTVREDTLKNGELASRATGDSLEFTWQHTPSGMTLEIRNGSGQEVTLVWDSSMASAMGGQSLEILPFERGMEYTENLRAPAKPVRSGKKYMTKIATLARNGDGTVHFIDLLPYPQTGAPISTFEKYPEHFTTTKHFLITMAIQRNGSLKRYSFAFAAEHLGLRR